MIKSCNEFLVEPLMGIFHLSLAFGKLHSSQEI